MERGGAPSIARPAPGSMSACAFLATSGPARRRRARRSGAV